MLAYVLLERFKCFSNQTLSLSALNILCGPNNSGKSSVIQALLFLRQSQILQNHTSNKFAINGPLLHLGTARDVFCQWADEETISLSMANTDYPHTINKWSFSYDKGNPYALFLTLIESNIEHLEKNPIFLPRFSYLNAERTGPQLSYPVSEETADSLNIGVRGEYTAFCLQQFADERIKLSELTYSTEGSQTLMYQAGKWLDYIIPGVRLKFERVIQADVVNMGVQNTSDATDWLRPTNVGFGISYCLPIVVAALMAEKNSMIIIENPEAHLHPAAQSRMGRFLGKVAASGVQVIIETHSDHILNGVRIAVKKKDIAASDVSINYVSSNHNVACPSIDKDGRIDEWPEGFFDQNEKDLWELV